jgi:heptosyltransferase-2
MEPMKIIVRAPNWVGDAVLALPAVAAVRRGFPGSELWVAARSGAGDIFAAAGLADRTVTLPEGNDLASIRQAARELGGRSLDAGLLLTNSFGSALLFYLARIPERWGYAADGRSLLLTRAVRRKRPGVPRHHVHYYLDLVAGLGIEASPPELRLSVSPEDSEAARLRLRELGLDPSRPLVILCPGASYGPAKRWPAERFARTAALLRERRGAEVLVIGSAPELELAESIRSRLAGKPAVLTGQTSLRELMGLIGRATLLISNDTGPMHLANALGVPVVGVFGPTDPIATGPLRPPSRVVKKDVPCWPCRYRECPLDHRCMKLILPEEVAAAAESIWP